MIKTILGKLKSHITMSNKVPKCAFYHNLLFIHIPKAAGSKVSFDLYGSQIGHKKAKYYYINDFESFSSVPSFSIVREPISRFLSAYNFLSSGGMSKIDREFKLNVLSKYNDINEFIEKEISINSSSIKKVPHFEPQYGYVYYNSTLLVDFVFKLEDLSSEKVVIGDIFPIKINLDFTSRKNQTKSIGYKYSDLNDRSKKILHDFYHKDYEVFGYER